MFQERTMVQYSAVQVTVTFFLLSVWRELQSHGHLTVFVVWWNVLIKGTENRLKLLEGRASTIKGRCESALRQIQRIWLDLVLWWIFAPDNYNCDVPQNHGNVFTSWPCHWKAQTVINKTAACSGIKAASTGQCAPTTAHTTDNT